MKTYLFNIVEAFNKAQLNVVNRLCGRIITINQN